MTEREREQRHDEQRPNGEEERPRVKVTDRRRVRADDPVSAAPAPDAHGPVVVEGGKEPAVGAAEPADDTAAQLVEATASQLEETRRQAGEYLDHLQRLKAEFDNYRKRVLKEQTRSVEMASEPLIRRLLEVVDEFELALIAAEQKPDFEKFRRGVELVYAKLLDILKAEGLQRIEADGKPFDPERHEALMQSSEGEGEAVVGDVYRQGYTMKGRVIRPAGVKVVRR